MSLSKGRGRNAAQSILHGLMLIAALAALVPSAAFAATLRLSELTAISRTSPGVVNAPGNVSCSFAITPGTSPVKSVMISYAGPNGSELGVVPALPSDLVGTAAIGKDRANGLYTAASVAITDDWDRTVVYRADGSVGVYDVTIANQWPGIVPVPARHAVDFSQLSFTVTGAGSTVVNPKLVSLMLVAGGTLSVGQSAKYAYTLEAGTAAITKLSAWFSYGTAENLTSYWVKRESPGLTGTFEVPITPDLINGKFSIAGVLFDAADGGISRTSYTYNPTRPGPLDFTIAGATNFVVRPNLTVSNDASGTVSPGTKVRYAFAVTPGTFLVKGVTFTLYDPYGSSRSVYVPSTSGVVEWVPDAGWLNGKYTVLDAFGTGLYGSSRRLELPDTGLSFTLTGGTDPGRPINAARIINLSVRAGVSADASPLIVGFGLGGSGTTGTAPLLVRGVGPTLQKLGVGDAVANPQLRVYTGATLWDANDDWAGNAEVTRMGNVVGAFGLSDAQSADAALGRSVSGGAYTVHLSEAQNRSGTVLAEVYDASNNDTRTGSTPRLVNISARTRVRPGEPLIAGFVLAGSGSRAVLIRGVGPTLANFGVSDALAAPTLTLYGSANHKFGENSGWAGATALVTAAQAVGAFALPATSKDAALLTDLPAGAYTVHLTGLNSTSGVALIEVYEVAE